AEVRFTVPTGGLAAIGSASLRGSEAVGSNEDFEERADGGIGSWTADPSGGDLSTKVATGAAGVNVANATAVAGALVQAFAVASGRWLEVAVTGRVTAEGE